MSFFRAIDSDADQASKRGAIIGAGWQLTAQVGALIGAGATGHVSPYIAVVVNMIANGMKALEDTNSKRLTKDADNTSAQRRGYGVNSLENTHSPRLTKGNDNEAAPARPGLGR